MPSRTPVTVDRGGALFEFCVRGPSISAQAKNKRRLILWRGTVSDGARVACAGRSIDVSSLELRLTEFSDIASKDRDNMAKPIQDAMQGILFENDRQILRLHVEWRDINGRYIVRHMSPVVAAALSAGHEFIWIRLFRHVPNETLNV